MFLIFLYLFPLHPLPSFLLLPVWLCKVAWFLETFLLKKTLLYLFLFFQKHKCPFNVAQSVTHHLLPILDPCVLQGKLENSLPGPDCSLDTNLARSPAEPRGSDPLLGLFFIPDLIHHLQPRWRDHKSLGMHL